MSPAAQKLIFIGIKGSVVALDRTTGQQVWETPLKSSTFVNIVLDGDDLIATTRGEVFCLNPANGRLRWNNPMRGFGWGLATIGTVGMTSMPAMAQYQRDQEESAAAAAAAAH